MQATKLAPIEYRSLIDLGLHLTVFVQAREISLRADDVWKDLPWKRFHGKPCPAFPGKSIAT